MLTTLDIELQADSDDHKFEFSHEIGKLSDNVIIRYRAKNSLTQPHFVSVACPKQH